MNLLNSKKTKLYKRMISLLLFGILAIQMLFVDVKTINAKTKYEYEGINTSYKLLVMKPGDTFDLDASKYYYIDVNGKLMENEVDCKATWKSNDNSVATINSNGKITAKSSGKCTITATWGKKKATCKVCVYTNKELYEQMLDAEQADDLIYLALKFNDYDILYGSHLKDKDAENQIKAANKVKEILNQVVKPGMTDFQKIMEIANWMEKNIRIDNSFESTYAQGLLMDRKEKYYIDGLLYGKLSDVGFGLLFDLLVNCCGIRSEWIKKPCSFNTDNNDILTVDWGNVVQLEGEWYYFNIIALGDYVDNSDDINKNCIYDRMVYTNKNIIHVTTNKFFEDSFNKKLDERGSFYSKNNLFYHYFKYLSYNTEREKKYYYSYFDFYTQSIRIVTYKDYLTKGDKALYPEPKFVSFASYPDSTCDKYKKIMDDEIDMINEVLEFSDEVDRVYASKDVFSSVNSNIFQELDQKMIEIDTKYQSLKSSLVDHNAEIYLSEKITKLKDTLAKMK